MTGGAPERCAWVGIADPEYARYHDEEWGVPKSDDRALFEKLVLEGFQSGLSWLTILQASAKTFAPRSMLSTRSASPATAPRTWLVCMADAGIVRNRLKIEATIDNARALLKLRERIAWRRFSGGWWTGGRRSTRIAPFKTVPAQTATSIAISKALKAQGFRFVGPTTVYAFMQATGMVNDHLVSCHRHAACAKLQRRFKRPRARPSA